MEVWGWRLNEKKMAVADDQPELVGAAVTAAAPMAVGPARPPVGDGDSGVRACATNGTNPVVVKLGLYITNLSSIDEAAETFEIQGYVYSRWIDP